MDRLAQFQSVCRAIFEKKSKLYGKNNVDIPGVLVRMRDKLARLNNLCEHAAGEELTDACRDMANYAFILNELVSNTWHASNNGDTVDRTQASHVGDVRSPARYGDAGYDLRAARGNVLSPNQVVWVETGAKILAPAGMWYAIKGRSSLTRRGILVLDNVIDQEYTGDLIVPCLNVTDKEIPLTAGERIAQVVFFPLLTPKLALVSALPDTSRGADGFGSTGAQ